MNSTYTNAEIKLTFGKRALLFLLLFFSFINISFPFWIYSDVFVLDIILLAVFLVYLINFLLGAKIHMTHIDKVIFYIPLLSIFSLGIVLYSGGLDYLRLKTAISAMVMMILFGSFVIVFSNIYRNSNFLNDLSRYFYYFCFVDFLYLTISLLFFGASRATRISPLIEGFLPFKESVLYVYGYILSKCLINKRWKTSHILILISSSIVNFAMFYRSLLLIWIVLTLFILIISTNNTKKVIQVLGLISIIILLLFSVFQATINDDIMSVMESSYEELTILHALLETDYEFYYEDGISRVFIWYQAIQNIIKRPLLGHGAGYEDYLGANGQIIQIYNQRTHFLATYHNQLWGFWVDYGFVGMFILYFILIKIGLLGLRLLKEVNTSKVKKHSIYCFIVIYIIYFISSFFGGRMIPAHPALYVVIPLWLFIAAIISEHNKMVVNSK